MQPVEVTARFEADGSIHPVSFSLQGKACPVAAAGRQWQDEQAGRHILVMAPDDTVYELVFIPAEGRWYLKAHGVQRPAA